MTEKYNSIFYIFLISLTMLILTSCGLTNNSSPGAVAKEQANTIMKCIEENDAATLKSLFTPNIQEMPELDEQIRLFLDFIDGKIVSYSGPLGGKDTGKIHDGETVYQELNDSIYKIQTDTGRNYQIDHNAIIVNKNDPDNLGVFYIRILDMDLAGQDDEAAECIVGDAFYPDD